MFESCSAYNQALPSSFNTSNVTNMAGMFANCMAFNQAMPSNFNTANVTDMAGMFANCMAFNQAMPSNFNTANVTDMAFMFENCTAFNQNIGNLNIGNATTMLNIFFNSGISRANYDAILIAWDAAGYTNKNLGDALPLQYCAGQTARTNMVTNKGWTITGDTHDCSCPSVATVTEEMTWTGTVSTDWANACNWSPNGVPTATNPVNIPNVANDPVISGTATCLWITNAGNLTINSSGALTVTTDAIVARGIVVESNSTLTNNGTLTATTSNSVFVILLNDNATFNNSGTTTLASAAGSCILFSSNNCTFTNTSTGIVNLQESRGLRFFSGYTGQTVANQGTINYSGTDYALSLEPSQIFNNSGIFNITTGHGIAVQGGTLNNLACGKMFISNTNYGIDNSATGSLTTNAGLIVTNKFTNTNGTFNNTGVVNHLPTTGTVTNTGNGAVHVRSNAIPIFAYGGTFNGTVDGIFSDAAATISAGTFTAPNNFTPSVTLPATLYAKITPSGGACEYVAPFTYGTCTSVATATETMTWTGAISTDWANACNWSPNGVPTATNTVFIPDVANDPVVLNGTTANCKEIILHSSAILTINNGGVMNINSNSSNGITVSTSASIVNNGTLSVSSATYGIDIQGSGASITNSGMLTITNSSNAGIFFRQNNTVVTNTSTGIINLQTPSTGFRYLGGVTGQTVTNQGTINYSGALYALTMQPSSIFNNSGTFNITSGSGIAVQGGTLNNLGCGKILMSSGTIGNSLAGSLTTNAGLIVTNYFDNTNGTFNNTGVTNRLPTTGTVTHTGNGAVHVRSNAIPIFAYGGTFNGTVDGIFSDAAATISAGTFTAPNNFTPSVTLPATLYAKITPSGGACEYVVPFTYVAPTLATTTISICSYNDITFTTTHVPNGIYTLSFAGSGSPQDVMVDNNAFTVSDLAAGNYSNFSLDVYGTPATVAQAISVNTLPNANITGTTTACSSVSLNATGGTSYIWSGGATPNSANNTFANSGTYTVTVSDANNCSATANRTITVNTLPNANITGTTTACSSVSLNATGGTSYIWSGGTTPNSANNTFTNSGTYTVTVSDANNCSATANSSITVNTLPTANITGTTTACSSVSLNATGGTSYTWSGGATPNSANNTFTNSGTYTVTVSDANNCSATANRTITVNT
ncbi:MAG: BspA family leucine-rich repeat surface protein, partial [Chitinophagales bacterium]|nr:BspA family leucine-rich repeat surface protein [Chitinophagales bacterium]